MAALNNPKHEHFAQLIAAGESATNAYSLTGYSENGAAQSANRLLKDAKVRERVSELQEAVAERAVEKAALDRAWVLDRLRENVERAMKATAELLGARSAAQQGQESIGRRRHSSESHIARWVQ